ncbi:MAG: glycerol-3-phosphate 1-O-acyltransferase PlsY [Clostridia bacterium]|nr:glycerol-3-phosphate 1-O-acyltransferase PlsY [Clostridia bacterium]MBR3681611.1 glycerol-3-phosphate 1-O-acyltransferase PlsY [Clostridia bacterium]
MSIAEFNAGGLISLFSSQNEFWYFAFLFLVLLASYLLGSLNSAIIVSRLLYGEDVRTKGSGNAGLTNMLRVYGKKAAILTLLGDLSKTVISVGIAGVVFGFGYFKGMSLNFILYAAGLFAVIGHIFPCYYRFKGGKGVLVTSTMALILTPLAFLALLLLFVLIVAVSKYVSLGSVSVAVLYPVVLDFYYRAFLHNYPDGLVLLCSMILAILIVWCHRENLKRIGNRTENKLSFGKKKNDEE